MISITKNIKSPLNLINLFRAFFTNPKNKCSKNTPSPRPIRVALLIDEYFGSAGTAYGGYGFLARRYIAKYIPNKDIQLDVLLNLSKKMEHHIIDGVNVYRLPKNKLLAKLWLLRKKYDLFLSIELTSSSHKILKLDNKKTPLLLWIQDPRPWYEWREINTVKLYPESCYWDSKVYEYVHELYLLGKVEFITQGNSLNNKARDLYRLNNDTPIKLIPNPVETSHQIDLNNKKNQIIFLGRIESVKRGWLFCEIAKHLPKLEFYVLGQTFREKDKMSSIISKYKKIDNLHFMGHVDGEEKNKYLMESKILVNTSIHEAIPISFLEALSYGTLIVSNRNPENLASKFGIWVGEVIGDGFESVNLYVKAIQNIIDNDQERQSKAKEAIQYINSMHNINKFKKDLRSEIINITSEKWK